MRFHCAILAPFHRETQLPRDAGPQLGEQGKALPDAFAGRLDQPRRVDAKNFRGRFQPERGLPEAGRAAVVSHEAAPFPIEHGRWKVGRQSFPSVDPKGNAVTAAALFVHDVIVNPVVVEGEMVRLVGGVSRRLVVLDQQRKDPSRITHQVTT